MKRSIVPMLIPLTLVLVGCGRAHSSSAQRPTPASTSHFAVALRPVNASGVSGTVRLDLTGNVLAIAVHASGLEPDQVHYQHIHGYPGSATACPSAAAAGAGGVITVEQGLAAVGPIALDLQPYPQVTGTGSVDWSQSYPLTSEDLSRLSPLTGHVVVMHGLTYQGTYDRALFIACGPIQAA
jgi:hypothetical protein